MHTSLDEYREPFEEIVKTPSVVTCVSCVESWILSPNHASGVAGLQLFRLKTGPALQVTGSRRTATLLLQPYCTLAFAPEEV